MQGPELTLPPCGRGLWLVWGSCAQGSQGHRTGPRARVSPSLRPGLQHGVEQVPSRLSLATLGVLTPAKYG